MIQNKKLSKFLLEERIRQGIGTLSEKTLHYTLKNYLEPRQEYQEVKIGKFIADIYNEHGIIEIQTRSFNLLRRKLETFLQKEMVTVVYPMDGTKWLSWIDLETGEVSKRRKSPKKGNYNDAFYELYKIKSFLNHPNLKIYILKLEIEEYRNLDGYSKNKKKGSSRFDRIPIQIEDSWLISSIEDYKKILPTTLPITFTSNDYARCSNIALKRAQLALNILTEVGAVKRVGMKGKSILYERIY